MVRVPIEIPPELLKKPKEKMEYHCSVCSKEFPHAYKLERHELIHTGEKPYCCSSVGGASTRRETSKRTTSVCGKGYSRAEELKVHHRLHTGERPYECGECGKSFIYRQGLRQHQRTHAGKRIGPTRQLGRPKQLASMDI
ncbi:hypothetical protein F7725_005962 [Dissostichus mawsoni]|uniref:C2H2-type domain-containing protein n=1 Tax=Dissostichus mawsoni TaxID=36200 RepID=A0A7J5YVT1_DISMA|nr:hypothetical protein F7725_005962 [Dissostichus mawsoni]